MGNADFITCPKCKSKTWVDILALGDQEDTMRFHCKRCGHLIKIGPCRICRQSNWKRLNEVHEKGARQPVVRYQCSGCHRIVGLLLDTVRTQNENSTETGTRFDI